MTLLREMMEQPLDAGYAAEAAKREAAGLPPGTGVRSPLLIATLVALGLLFGVAAVTLNRAAPEVTRVKTDLVNQIMQRRATAEQQGAEISATQSQISAAEVVSGPGDQGRLRALEEDTGALPARGPGLVLTLDDAPSKGDTSADGNPRTSVTPNGGTVIARDVQITVNALWQAGAEAIAVNGQRLSSRSAIRFAGDAILVNFRPLTRPYTITAIGDPQTMPAAFAAGTGGAYLSTLKSNFGIAVTTRDAAAVTVPGATSLTVRYAKPVAPTRAGPTDPTTTSTTTSTTKDSP